MQLSPRDFPVGIFHVIAGDADIGLGHFDAAIDAYRKALELGPHGQIDDRAYAEFSDGDVRRRAKGWAAGEVSVESAS